MSAPAVDLQDPEITPTVVAEHMGWSRAKAKRFMAAIHITHPHIVQRRGRGHGRMFTTLSKIRPFLQGLRPSPLESEVKMLRARVADLDQRQDAEAQSNIRFRELAHKWFDRVAKLERSR